MKGVVSVDPDSKVYALNDGPTKAANSVTAQVTAPVNESNEFLDIPEIWEMGYEGTNVKVAVLDTGIDYNHPEFEGVYKGGHNFVPHGIEYARDRAANDPYETARKTVLVICRNLMKMAARSILLMVHMLQERLLHKEKMRTASKGLLRKLNCTLTVY